MATATFQSILPDILPFRIPAFLQNLFSRALGIHQMESLYRSLQGMDGSRSIATRLLDLLGVSCDVSAADLAHVPTSGPAILTLNHPFGILEGALIAALLGSIRTDVRFLANGILTAIPELRELMIAVDPMTGRDAASANGTGLRHALDHLQSGGMLVIFPAGEVSHFHWGERGVADREWNPAVARMVALAARKGCKVTVVPAFVAGANSSLFQLAGILHASLRTAMLGRELLNKKGRTVEIRIGAGVPADKLLAMPGPRERIDYLRWRTYLLARRQRFDPQTAVPVGKRTKLQPTAVAALPEELADDIAALAGDCLLTGSGDLEVYLASASQIPRVLPEIGRLREITFRGVDEGTGKAIDLDRFDEHYLHLFVWHARKREVVGAYRLARTDTVQQSHGVRGLYTATLFDYGKQFLELAGPSIELGRSFVRQEYQKGFAPLLLLWKGIGTYVARNPECRCLFGPVSISNRYESLSRELMVSYLETFSMLREWKGLVRKTSGLPGRLLKGVLRPAFPQSGFDVDDLSTIVSDVEQNQAGVPVLLRQYLRLGGKLLGFHVDPNFSNALDGLILVDLTKTEPKLLDRYLGKHNAMQFLEYQKGK